MKIKKCRICKNTKLKRIGSLGKIAVSDFTIKPQKGTLSPLTLIYCAACTLLQLDENPSRKKMYEKRYWYESSLNPTIINDLKSVVSDALQEIKPQKEDIWMDIGANDGTLLSFVPKEFVRVGVDPAKNLRKSLTKHADKIIQTYFDKAKITKKAKIITAIAMFYDLPDPHAFTKKLKLALIKDGVAIIQLMTLSPMIEQNDVGNICHEHIEYYSYKSLTALFEMHGLEIYKVKTNAMNGGSYRLFLRHKTNGSITHHEKIYSVTKLKSFFKRVEKNKKDFIKFLKVCKKAKKTVIAYGASTKGNTIMQYYGLTKKDIPSVVDINPDKLDRFLISTGIPVVDHVPPCDYLWVLPYAFIEYFQKKEKLFKKNGGKFIVSTPTFMIR